MRPERWNELTPLLRRETILESDRSLRDPRWKPLIERMATAKFEDLTELQQAVITELP